MAGGTARRRPGPPRCRPRGTRGWRPLHREEDTVPPRVAMDGGRPQSCIARHGSHEAEATGLQCDTPGTRARRSRPDVSRNAGSHVVARRLKGVSVALAPCSRTLSITGSCERVQATGGNAFTLRSSWHHERGRLPGRRVVAGFGVACRSLSRETLAQYRFTCETPGNADRGMVNDDPLCLLRPCHLVCDNHLMVWHRQPRVRQPRPDQSCR